MASLGKVLRGVLFTTNARPRVLNRYSINAAKRRFSQTTIDNNYSKNIKNTFNVPATVSTTILYYNYLKEYVRGVCTSEILTSVDFRLKGEVWWSMVFRYYNDNKSIVLGRSRN